MKDPPPPTGAHRGTSSPQGTTKARPHPQRVSSGSEEDDWDFDIGKLVIDLDSADQNSGDNMASSSSPPQQQPPPKLSAKPESAAGNSSTIKVKIKRFKCGSSAVTKSDSLGKDGSKPSPAVGLQVLAQSDKAKVPSDSKQRGQKSSKKDKSKDSKVLPPPSNGGGSSGAPAHRSLDNHPTPALASYALAHVAATAGSRCNSPKSNLTPAAPTFLTTRSPTVAITAASSSARAKTSPVTPIKASATSAGSLRPVPTAGSASSRAPGSAVGMAPAVNGGEGPRTAVKREAPDPYEFNAKMEDCIRPPAKKVKVEKVDACGQTSPPVSPVHRCDASVETVNQAVITEPDCLGPCEPGTHVVLEGIVWNETLNGLLVVNVTWRGKTYVGTLMDATRHDWAPPRLNCDSPTSDLDSRAPKGRGGKRGRGGGPTPKNVDNGSDRKLRSNSTRRSNQASQYANWSSNRPVESRRRLRNTESENTNDSTPPKPVKRTRTDSKTSENGEKESSLIECPEPNCSKKYRHINGLKYHQSHAHKNSTASLKDDSSSRDSVSTKKGEERREGEQEEESGEERAVESSRGVEAKPKAEVEGSEKRAEDKMKEAVVVAKPSSSDETIPGTASPADVPQPSSVASSGDKPDAPSCSPPVSVLSIDKRKIQPTVALTPVTMATAVSTGATVSGSMVYQISAAPIACLGTIVTQAASQITVSGAIVQATHAPAPALAASTLTAIPVTVATTNLPVIQPQDPKRPKTEPLLRPADPKKIAKVCPSVTNVRPIMPAPTAIGPQVNVVHAQASMATAHLTSGSLSSGGTQLKPIQPKPTTVPSSVDAALAASLKQMKQENKKPKKKKKDKDKERSKSKHSKSSSSKSQKHHSKEHKQPANNSPPKLEKQPPVTQPTSTNTLTVPKDSKEKSKQLDDAHSPAYSDISDANEAAPTLEKEAVAATNEPSASSSSSQSGQSGAPPYYSQPPSLTPAVTPSSTQPTEKPQKAPEVHHKVEGKALMGAQPVTARTPSGGHEGSAPNPSASSESQMVGQPGKGASQDNAPKPAQNLQIPGSSFVVQGGYRVETNYHMHMMNTNPEYRAQHEKYMKQQQESLRQQVTPPQQISPGQKVTPPPAHSPAQRPSPVVKPSEPGIRENNNMPPPPGLISDQDREDRKRREADQNLKEIQNENRQILKENIELKAQMDPGNRARSSSSSSGAVLDPHDQKALYDRQQHERQRYYLYQQQKYLEQQQQQQQQRYPSSAPSSAPSRNEESSRPPSAANEHKGTPSPRPPKGKEGGVNSPSLMAKPQESHPTMSFGQIYGHPYLQPGGPYASAVTFDPNHPAMYNSVIGYSSPATYIHPAQVRYQVPRPDGGDKPVILYSPSDASKPLDLAQVSAPSSTSSQFFSPGSVVVSAPHKIHELKEVAKSATSPQPTSKDGERPSSRNNGKEAPTQRHLHTHHHTHVVGPAYPVYPTYGATIIAPSQVGPSGGSGGLSPHSFAPTSSAAK